MVVKQKRHPVKTRLSQCMIVKNEEKNVEKALSWAKSIAFEQIVVDTGSTDRTVEIAKRMGAKVYHFEWIDDFAAAKNYAIEQAMGNWIAFLDADEYLPEGDAEKLMATICALDDGVMKLPVGDPRDIDCVRTPLVNFGDDGKSVLMAFQERFFRNRPHIRYIGAIHEKLNHDIRRIEISNITIVHTGYMRTAVRDARKARRNVRILRKELERNPEDPQIMAYLADSLLLFETETAAEEAASLFTRVLGREVKPPPYLMYKAYNHLLSRCTHANKVAALELCRKAAKDLPDVPDYYLHIGTFLGMDRDYVGAWEAYKKCEEVFNRISVMTPTELPAKMGMLYRNMLTTAIKLSDKKSVIHYATLVLREDKHTAGLLPGYIAALKADADDEGVLTVLSKLYDFSDVRDKLFVARAAKDAGELGLVQKVLSMISAEEFGRAGANGP